MCFKTWIKLNLLIILFINLKLHGQTYVFDTYALDEGLPQTQVTGVIEDHLGQLWVSTLAGGVSIFDGKNFKPIDFGDIRSNRVESLHKNTIGEVLVASTSNSLFYIFDSNKPGKPIKTYQLEDRFLGTIISGYDCFYISSPRKGLYRICSNQIIKLSSSLNTTLVKSVSGKPLVIIDDVLYSLENSKLTKFKSDPNFNNLDIRKFAWLTESGELWYANKKSSFSCYHNGVFRHFTGINGGTDSPISGMQFQGDSMLWLTVEKEGLGKFHDGKLEIFRRTDELAKERYFNLFIDSKARIWTLSNGAGLHLFKGEKITNYSKNDDIIFADSWSIIEDKNGFIWAGTYGGGLIRIKEGKGKTYNKELGLANDLAVLGIEISDDKEFMYLGTDKGLFEVRNNKAVKIPSPSNLAFTSVYDLEFYNDKLFFAAASGTYVNLYVYDGKKVSIVSTATREKTDRLSVLHELNGKLYIGGNGFFGEVVGDSLIEKDLRLRNINIGYILDMDDHAGNLYLATNRQTIVLTRDNEVKFLTKEMGMTSHVAFFIQVDQLGKIWVGHEKGVDVIDVDNEFNIINKKFLGSKDGIDGGETNQGAGYIDSKGNVWIGTVEGLSKYNPKLELKNLQAPNLFINEIRLFHESQDWVSNFNFQVDNNLIPIDPVFAHDKNHITIDLTAINLNNPSGVRYQYILEGWEPDWAPPTKVSAVTYRHLAPNTYNFKVRACNEDGVWTNELSYNFTISPPIWERNWFKLTILLSVLTIALSWVKLREKKLKKETEALQDKVYNRTRELLAQKDLLEEQKEVIEKKNNLITDSLDYAQKIQQSILPSKHMFSQFFDDHFILFQPKDIVSGDFYWMRVVGKWALVACVDCTGHGVPGAFMSIISQNILDVSANSVDQDNLSPSKILADAKARMQIMKDRYYDDSMLKDGMAISLLAVHIPSKKAKFAGSYHSLYKLRNGGIEELKGDRIPIGHKKFSTGEEGRFGESSFQLIEGDQLYLFTDGYADQKGGPKNKKYFYQPLRDILVLNRNKTMEEQKAMLLREFNSWKGQKEQYDDVLMIGIKI